MLWSSAPDANTTVRPRRAAPPPHAPLATIAPRSQAQPARRRTHGFQPRPTALSVSTVTLFALPGYWLGLMLVLLFTYRLRALPSFGAHGYDGDALAGLARLRDLLRHVALPLATLTLVGIGGTARFVRGAMLDARAAPFVTTALAKGLAAPRVWLHHVLRNALVPVVP